LALSDRPILLRVLLFREPHDPDTWVAQALEHDIAAFGRDVEQAKRAFEKTVYGYIELAHRYQQRPFETLRPAPEGFWEIWQKVAGERTMPAEPIPFIPGHMIPAVTDEPVQTAH
jgi:hypothetical protein